MGEILAFANQKGGVGKSTTCINFSAFMALMGKKVLIIDIDSQGNTTSGLGRDKTEDLKSIYNVLVGDCDIKEAIYKTDIANLDLVPTNLDLAGAEVELINMKSREFKLKSILNEVKDDYDFITIDCPPSLMIITINALTAADGVIIPIPCEFFALEGLSQLMNTIRIIKKQKLNPDLKVEGVVLTMRDTRSNLGKQVADEIGKFFGTTLFNTSIPRNIRLAEAPSHGLPIYLYDKNCAGSIAYMNLVEEYFKRKGIKYKKIKK